MTVTAWLLIALTLFTILLVAWAAFALGGPAAVPPRAEPWSSPPAPPEYLPAHRLETRLRWPGHHLER
jgi:hypothetical protein